MRILFLQDWNPLSGGAERYALALRDGFRDNGDELRLLTASASPEAAVNADYLARASDHVLPKSLLQLHNPFAAAAVRRALRDFRPHAVLVNMFALYLSPAALLALRPLPFVLLVSDYKIVCPAGHRLLPDGRFCELPKGAACLRQGCLSPPHWLRDMLRYRLIDAAVRRAAAVVATSRALQEVLAAHGIESQSLPLFSAEPAARPVRQPDPEPRFLYLGRLDVEKGVDDLLRAFAIVSEAAPASRLRIAGRGAMQGSLERLAAELGMRERVDFLGWLGPEDVDRELGRAWALVAPSRWPEPFGLVALEAIQRGVPAVVPAHGGLAETVTDGRTGLCYPPGDVEALARALLSIARAESFPPQGLAEAAVAETARRFAGERHLTGLRHILRQHAVTPGSGSIRA